MIVACNVANSFSHPRFVIIVIVKSFYLSSFPALRLLRAIYSFLFFVVRKPVVGRNTGTDAILTELLKPKAKENKMTSMSRTQQKLALQREHLLKQEQKKKEQERQRQLGQSSEITIPFTRPTETMPPYIPPTVLDVRITLLKIFILQ